MNKAIKLQWYSDPQHAWLKVKTSDAKKLGLFPQSFSRYSYQSKAGNVLYLEEDCDAPILLEALKRSTEYLSQWMIDRHSNNSSPIRKLRSLPYYKEIAFLWSREMLNDLEAWIKNHIQPSFTIPRPCDQFPWNGESYREVVDNTMLKIKEHGWCCYLRKDNAIIVTSDRLRAVKEMTERIAIKSERVHIIHVK